MVATASAMPDAFQSLDAMKAGSLSRIGGAKHQTPEQIDKAAEEFEAVFISQMLGHMFEGVQTNPFGSPGEQSSNDIYKSLMTDQYGKIIAQSGGIGIADYVKQEMINLQEVEA